MARGAKTRNSHTKAPARSPHPGLVDYFRHFAAWASAVLGSPLAFAAACASVVVWGLLGPLYHYSDSWELWINTVTTIFTFLMVFLIQNAQNRDAKSIQLKLDELIRAVHDARTRLVGLEKLDDAELARLEKQFDALRDEG